MNIRRVSGTLLWVTLLWMGLWHDVSVANLVSGLAVGVVVLVVAGQAPLLARDDADRLQISPLRTLHFGAFVLYKLVEANLFLAWEILTPENDINVGVIAVPLRTDSPIATMVVAHTIALTPGTLAIETIGSPVVLYVNVMHLHDVERVRRDLLRIEELSVRAFGSRSAREQLASSKAAA